MFSYFTDPFLRYFRSTAEHTPGRKRNHARMIPVDSESDGPVTKRLCRSRSATVLPSSGTKSGPPQGQGSLGFGNYVHDWFVKIGQMAAKPTLTLHLGQVQSLDFPDEEAENERQTALSIASDRKVGMPGKPPLEAMAREPLHITQPWRVISSGNEDSWNGHWDHTYQISGAVGSDTSVRRKQKSFSLLPRRKEEEFASEEESSRSTLSSNKFKKLRKRQGKKFKTPLEPIRLDEREQYRLLLEKCKVGLPLASTLKNQTEPSSTSSSGCAVRNGHFKVEKLASVSKSQLANRLHSAPQSSGSWRNSDRRSSYAGTYLSLPQKRQQSSTRSHSKLPFSKSTERLQMVSEENCSSTQDGKARLQDQESYNDLKRTSSDDSGRGTEHSSSKGELVERKPASTFESTVFSKEWLKNLQVSIDDRYKTRTEKQDLLEKRTSHLREKREAKIFADNRKSLHKLRKTLKLRSPDASEEEDDKSQLPELTPEMERKIEEALRPNPGDEVISEGFRLSIARRDMETLSGLNWLNDEIVNFYMNLLMERGKNDNFPSCYAFNTFFYPKLIAGGHEALKRWTRKVDVFSHDFILIPVHLGMHWCLAVIDFRQKKIQYYDSMGGQNNECLNALRIYLQDESRDKKKAEYDMTEWKLETVKNIPQQMNGSDCGMFTLKYAEYITRNAKITFSQRHMPYFRRRMVFEIATKNLL